MMLNIIIFSLLSNIGQITNTIALKNLKVVKVTIVTYLDPIIWIIYDILFFQKTFNLL